MEKTVKNLEFSYKLKGEGESDAGKLSTLRCKSISLNAWINASMMIMRDMDDTEMKLKYIAMAERELK